MSRPVRVRVAVVLPQGDRLLVVRHVTLQETWWCLPGGRLEPGETLTECGVRELREETCLDIEIEKLLYLGDFIQGDRHVVEPFFLGRVVGGQMALGEDGHVRELRFVRLGELAALGVKPECVVERIVRDWPEGFRAAGVYVGQYG